MKFYLTAGIMFALLATRQLAAQEIDSTGKVFTIVDEQAQPPGGLNSYYRWIAQTLRYPPSAVYSNKEGKVFVSFIVEPSGQISMATVVKGFDPDCDLEAQRVISTSPNWAPAKLNGRSVRSAFTVPIAFKLTGDVYRAESFESVVIDTRYGALLLYNGTKNSFSLRLVAKSFQLADKPNSAILSGYVFQSLILPFTRNTDYMHLDVQAQQDLLEEFLRMGRFQVEQALKKTIHDDAKIVKVKSKPFLQWVTDQPEELGGWQAQQRVLLATICFDQLLMLHGPVLRGQNVKDVTKRLLKIAATLVVKPNEVQDMSALHEVLKK